MSSDRKRTGVADLKIEGYNNTGVDLSSLLERHHFGEIGSGADYIINLPKSLPSKTAFSVSIPNPENPESEFVYNYFVPSERAQIHGDIRNIVLDASRIDTDDIEYIASVDKKPRFVRVKFTPPDFTETVDMSDVKLEFMGGDVETLIGVTADNKISLDLAQEYVGNFNLDLGQPLTKELIGEIVNHLIVEGAASNPTFTGVEFIDTYADNKIYTMLSSSMAFQNVGVNANSPRERAELFRDKITAADGSTNPLGTDKSLLVDVLSQLQPAGVSLAPGDVTEDAAGVAADPVSKQSFSVKFGNLFFDDIVKYSSFNANTVYEDEMRALELVAKRTQNALITSIDPTLAYEHDYQMQVKPLSIQPVEFTQSTIDALKSFNISILQTLKAQYFPDGTSSPQEFNDWIKDLKPNSPEQLLLNSIAAGITDPVSAILNKMGLPKIKIVGYLIQKSEALADGTVQKFSDVFIDNPKHFTEYIDEHVRYGAVYNYKLRSLAMVKSVIKVINKADGTKKYAIADFLMLSDGTVTSAHCVENIPPPPPVRVGARVDYDYRKPVITWEFPLNLQRDIKRFQVFKRHSFDEPFTLMAEYDFDDSFSKTLPNETAQKENLHEFSHPYRRFVDHDFNLHHDQAMYAIACVDAHGLSSNYSKQIMIKYDKYTNRLSVKCVSVEGAPKPYPNLYIRQDFFEDLIRKSGSERCTIFFDPEYYKIKKHNRHPRSRVVVGEEEVVYLKTSDTEYNYNFSFINVDLQVEQNLDVRIADKTGIPGSVPAADISSSNLSFEFGSTLGETRTVSATEPTI